MEDQSMFGEREVSIYLPPGFRFFPTDEEIITSYLSQKVALPYFTARAIGEADLNKCEPWDLPSKAKMGENEWYFFCQKDRKYPTGIRTNRATGSGYWKATGKDREIFKGEKTLIGMKKTLVFYKGRAPNGEKTNWVMHEFRLEGSSFNHHYQRSPKDEWVVSKIFHKNVGLKRDTFGAVTNKNSNYSDPNIASTSSNQHSPLDNSFDLSYLNQNYPSDLWCNNTLLSERNESAGLMMPNRDAYGYLNDVTKHHQWKL